MRTLQFIGAVLVAVALMAAPGPVRAAPFYVQLTIDLNGTGSGSFQTLATSGGAPDSLIDCRQVNGVVGPQEICSQQWDAGDDHTIRIYYRVAPAPGSCIDAIGPCSEASYSSYFDLTGDATAYYTFNKVSYSLTVGRGGLGSGLITSNDFEIACPLDCSAVYGYNASVRLTALANSGSYFSHWVGPCYGQDATCDLVMTSSVDTTAIFILGNPPTPIVTAGPTPSATAAATSGSTPRATAGPSSLPSVAPGTSPETSPGGSGGASLDPTASGSAAPTEPGGSTGPPSPGESASSSTEPGPVAGPGSGSGSDLTPVILAILAAGLLMAIAIAAVGFGLLRQNRDRTPPA